MTDNPKANWAAKFAEIVEEFVWLEAGGEQTAGDRNVLFRDAINALHQYKAEASKVGLKEAIRLAVQRAPLSSDPWKIALEAIAARAADWEQHTSEDKSTTQDIAAWLIHEASQ